MLFGADHTFSFPSGHVLGACDFLLVGTFLIFSRRENPKAALLALRRLASEWCWPPLAGSIWATTG